MPPKRVNAPRQRRPIPPPPPQTTWGSAIPALAIAGVFYMLQLMFTWLIFFGPLFVGLVCKVATDSTIAGVVCTVAAGAASVAAAAAAIEAFGLIMAEVIGFVAWGAVFLYIFVRNRRLLTDNFLWMGASLIWSEVLFINSLPALPVTIYRMYRVQIKKDKEKMKKYREERAAAEFQERREQAAELAQFRMAMDEIPEGSA